MTKRTKKSKKITLGEFKAWLEGIEDLQPDDWCPDLSQWKLIKEKIKSIDHVEYVDTVENTRRYPGTNPPPNRPKGPPPVNPPQIPLAPPVPSSIPSGEFEIGNMKVPRTTTNTGEQTNAGKSATSLGSFV